MRIGKLAVLLALLASPYLHAQETPTPQFWLQLRLSDAGSLGTALPLHEVVTSGNPFMASRTDQAGTSVYESYLVSQFELVSISANCVILRFRLKWFEANIDAVIKGLGVGEIRQVLDAAKVPWRTMAYIPGAVDRIPLDGTFLQMSGSIRSK